MTRTQARPTRKTSRRPERQAERRRAPRGKLRLLTAFRCLDGDAVTSTGFARALNLSTVGALIESPDPFGVGQIVELEFLLDNNRVAQVQGQVTRVGKQKSFYHVAVGFGKIPAPTRRLLTRQVGA